MGRSIIFEGRLHSPYSIFLRQPHPYSNLDLLCLFGLRNYLPSSPVTCGSRRAIVADASGWTMLSDDWYYTLWHAKTTTAAIQSLVVSHDIFTCTEGDCDRSFDYRYYRDGKLVRKYTVESPEYNDRQVVTNYGEMIPGETTILDRDGYNIGLDVASLLDIQTRFAEEDLCVFVPPVDQVQ